MARRYPNTFKRETRKIRLQDFGRHVDRGMSKLQKDSDDLVIQGRVVTFQQLFSSLNSDRAYRLKFYKIKFSSNPVYMFYYNSAC